MITAKIRRAPAIRAVLAICAATALALVLAGCDNNASLGGGGGNGGGPGLFTQGMVSAGGDHAVAIATGGTLWATGVLGNIWDTPLLDRFIRIGDEYDWTLVSHGLIALRMDGSIWGLNPLEPVQATAGHVWIHVDGGLAIREDGSLWQWGLGIDGAFSDLVQVGTRADWVRAHHGAWGAFAIDEAGGLWAWGSNQFGQLGIGAQRWDGRYNE